MNGKMGGKGNQDGDAIMVDKAGIMGQMYIRLWKMTDDSELLDAAIRIGNTLLSIQLPDGRWQNRVENTTGKMIQDYTSNQIFNIIIMDQLFEATGDQRYADSSKRALDWVIANPIKTYKWIGYYEDVEVTAQSVGNWDAIETARYLIANRDKSPEYLKIARDISDWIGTTFAVDQCGVWPLICEQSVCMPVMSCHTLHYACLLSDLYKATGENYYRLSALSAARAGFDLCRNNENWYSLTSAPLYLGLELARDLGL